MRLLDRPPLDETLEHKGMTIADATVSRVDRLGGLTLSTRVSPRNVKATSIAEPGKDAVGAEGARVNRRAVKSRARSGGSKEEGWARRWV